MEQTLVSPPSDASKPRPIEKKPSVVFKAPDLARPGESVSEAEICFFLDHGFLVKKRLLDKTAVEEALGKTWAYLRDQVPMADGATAPSPDDSATWLSPRWAPMPQPDESGLFQGRQRIVYGGHTVKLHDLGDADFLMDLVPNHPRVRAVAQAILGDDLRPSERTRGVYAMFPNAGEVDPDDPERLTRPLGPHTDQVCQQLNACAYLDDVPPRSGGFTVYPGSHKIMFRAHRFEANWSPLPDFRNAVRKVVAEIEPVEFAGDKGDVIFWHGRTVHSSVFISANPSGGPSSPTSRWTGKSCRPRNISVSGSSSGSRTPNASPRTSRWAKTCGAVGGWGAR